jgi:hypothetical protein
MFHWASSSMKSKMPWLASLLVCGFLVLAFLLIDSRSASALPTPSIKVNALPRWGMTATPPFSSSRRIGP